MRYLAQVSAEIVLTDVTLNLSGVNNRHPKHLKVKKEVENVNKSLEIQLKLFVTL